MFTSGVTFLGTVAHASGTTVAPASAFSSEVSLGWYRSGASTMGLSYGRVNWGASGVAAPTTTTYSGGVKLILFDTISGSVVGYTLGIDSNTMYFTVPSAAAGQTFKWYGSTVVIGTLVYPGIFSVADGSAVQPSSSFLSESSLGLFRSGTSTLALSYGTLNLNQARFVSVRTAASLDSTSLVTNEMAFQIVAGSVATLAIRSGGTIYYFASSASTKG